MRIRLVYILSFIEKSLAFEWVVDGLDHSKYELHFILLGRDNTPIISFLKERSVAFTVIQFGRKMDIVPAFIKIVRYLKRIKPDVVHAHLFDAGRLGITAAWMLRIKKRIYTRHYGSYHHDQFPAGVYFDKIINRLATSIIAVSPAVAAILSQWEKVPARKIISVPHGFDIEFLASKNATEALEIKKKYNVPETKPVIGVISRFTESKGLEYIINAFSKIRSSHPQAHLVLANAVGDLQSKIRKTLAETLPADSYTQIEFEPNVRALYHVFDVFVHVPVDPYCEAFGQTYVEALACGVPSVFTLSGIAPEFIQHEKNALVVPFRNSDAIALACEKLLKDETLRNDLKEQGLKDVRKLFGIKTMVARIQEIYSK